MTASVKETDRQTNRQRQRRKLKTHNRLRRKVFFNKTVQSSARFWSITFFRGQMGKRTIIWQAMNTWGEWKRLKTHCLCKIQSTLEQKVYALTAFFFFFFFFSFLFSFFLSSCFSVWQGQVPLCSCEACGTRFLRKCPSVAQGMRRSFAPGHRHSLPAQTWSRCASFPVPCISEPPSGRCR